MGPESAPTSVFVFSPRSGLLSFEIIVSNHLHWRQLMSLRSLITTPPELLAVATSGPQI